MKQKWFTKKYKFLIKKKRLFLKLMRRLRKKHWVLFKKHWILHLLAGGVIGVTFLAGLLFIPHNQKVSAVETLSCSVATSCPTGVVIFRMNATSNSHSEVASQANYSQLVCCTGVTGLGNSCSGNYVKALRLSGATNAHVEQNDQATAAYNSNSACISANTGTTITVAYQNTNCTGYDTTVASISGTTNAHVGDASAFTKKVCATVRPPQDLSWITGAADFKIYQSSSLTWGAGTLICSGTLTDTNASTIDCGSTPIFNSTQYRVEMKLKNTGSTLTNMDGSSEYIEHIAVKSGWAGATPTLGTCGFNDVDTDDTGSTACTAAFSGNDVRLTESGAGSINLAATTGTQGYAYLITTGSDAAALDSNSYAKATIDGEVQTSSKVAINGPGTAFQIQTGYYIGDGTDSRAVTGVGFQPEVVLIQHDSATYSTYGAKWKSSSMTGETTAYTADANATSTSNMIQSLDANGFTLGTDADVNTANERYIYIAFRGSTCSSSGTFCSGMYTGDGASTKTITTGFQPNFVLVKSAGASAAVFRTSGMATNLGVYLINTAENSSGGLFTTQSSTGFTVGNAAEVNTANLNYYYIAFKITQNVMNIGSYTGNATDNTNISGVGFQPDFAMVKGTGTTRTAAFNIRESYGDASYRFNNTGFFADAIQALQSDGFQVGTLAQANAVQTYHYIAMKGVAAPSVSGSYTMKVGSYVGDGDSPRDITGVGFAPDLVIVKYNGASEAVFRTRLMSGDKTQLMGAGGGAITNGITGLGSDGFTVGTNENGLGFTYQWQAFGNAYKAGSSGGAADFSIGMYYGNGIDSRNITRTGFQPDFTAIKNDSASGSLMEFRTSAMSGDAALAMTSTSGETADIIQSQAITSGDGFQIGTNSYVNTLNTIYWWFQFKTSARFAVGSYTGTGSAHSETGPGFQPDLVWVRKTASGVLGINHPSSLSGDNTMYFTNAANTAGRITGFVSTGFSVGTDGEANANSATYRYIAWKSSGGFFYSTGTLLSDSIDTNSYPTITNKNALRAVWSYSVPTSCTLTIKFRGTDTGPPADYSGSTWSSIFTASTASTTQTIDLTAESALLNKRFFQYQLDMAACSSDNSSPKLFDVRMDFD